jgi:beta-N-acetylhexosaminidase
MVDESGGNYKPVRQIFCMMSVIFKIAVLISLSFISCSSGGEQKEIGVIQYSLSDFYSDNSEIDQRVREIFEGLDEKVRIGQMIVTSAGTNGKPTSVVENLIKKQSVGGVLLLGGDKHVLKNLAAKFDSLAKAGGALPLLYSADAEPSLINRKIKGTQTVPNAIDLLTESASDSVASIIAKELLSMKIRHNFAPVLDLSPDNVAITNRTFGSNSDRVIALATAFIRRTQQEEIVATAKHFPGHGLVSGDTHQSLVAIDGEMKEVPNYQPLIDLGVISIMVGHIAVINNEIYNTHGLPSSCSSLIVTELLKKKLGFKGIVITDAMNMGALKQIENASLRAVEAGCDMILMEPNETKLLEAIYAKYKVDKDFKEQVDSSVRKIIRLKVCLNLM